MPTRSIRHALTVAVLAAAASSAPCFAQHDDVLRTGRELWRIAALGDYEYGYQKYCDCYQESPPETLVTVRGGQVVAVRHRRPDAAEDVPAEQRNLEFYWTVDGLFDLVESALGRGVDVRTEYHETFGYPTRIYIDYDRDFIGDELDLRLTRVTPLAQS